MKKGLNNNVLNNSNGSTVIGGSLLLATLIYIHLKKDKDEHFTSGFGFEMPDSVHPIFLNMYAQNLTKDFGLFDVIQHLKYSFFSPNLDKEITVNRNMNPIVFIPGLGTSSIKGKWNKSDSKTVRSIEESEKWSCRQVQNDWTKLWFPESDLNVKVSQYCWEDNVKVVFNNNRVENSEGVTTTVDNFGSVMFEPNSYLNNWLDSVKALGYRENENLFGAAYDFRKICSLDELNHYCMSLKQLIERSVHLNGKQVVLVGHSLGSNLANYFLVSQSKEWKDRYINSFATFSGAFGGCPKALRTVLSGVDVTNKIEKDILKNITKNFTGLQWMLPVPGIYNDTPLVHYNNVSYSASHITELLIMAGAPEAAAIYNNVVLPVHMESLKAPNVTVYTFSGTNLMTESSYKYKDSLTDNPSKNYPYYQMNQAYANNSDYPEEFNGDGTIPHFALQFPLSWTTQQKEPIMYRFYNRAEHNDILNIEQPVKDFISVLKQLQS